MSNDRNIKKQMTILQFINVRRVEINLQNIKMNQRNEVQYLHVLISAHFVSCVTVLEDYIIINRE